MAKLFQTSLFATTALALALPTAAFAQETAVEEDSASSVGDIIVTARRTNERLQDIPVSAQVVSGEDLAKLAVNSVEEISKLAPGLTLVNAGSSTNVTLRGVTWQPGSGTPATPIYFNEVPFDPGNTIVSMFDVGQIEVLRGPQGTTRGAPSISGAVTLTTRKPDLQEFGGFVQGQYGEGNHWNVQAAVNAPVIADVLAIRLAVNLDEGKANRVTSVGSTIQPFSKDRSYRATVLLAPTDTLSIQAMYQRRETYVREYTPVVGAGSPGAPAVSVLPAIPAGYNIPAGYTGGALTLDDRKSVQDLPGDRPQHVDLITVNANWEVFSHNISYNYGRQINRSPLVKNAVDTTNIIPGYEHFTEPFFPKTPTYYTHEIRLSSLPDPDRPFDYDIGWYEKFNNGITGFNLYNYTPGAFGAPYSPAGAPGVVTTPNNAYLAKTDYRLGIRQRFDSFYGNVRFHLTDATELSGGLAILRDHITLNSTANTSSFLQATPQAFFLGAPCSLVGQADSANYLGYCDKTTAASSLVTPTQDDKYSKAIYNFSLSHKVNDDLLVYATTGSSFRTGLASLGNTGIPDELAVPKPESAKSYEIGFKATIDRWFKFNADVFQLDYKNQLTTLEGVRYFDSVSTPNQVRAANVSTYGNLDARVRGFEIEMAANPADGLDFGANVSYSKIKAKGGSIPCTIPGNNPTIDTPFRTCAVTKGQVLNTQAPLQITANGSYEVPVTGDISGYFRFNVAYRGNNPNYGNFRDAAGNSRKVGSYAIVDLFAGVNGGEGAWNLGVYAKNVFNKVVELSRLDQPNNVFALYQAPGGYNPISTNLPREVGVQLRYAFGSR